MHVRGRKVRETIEKRSRILYLPVQAALYAVFFMSFGAILAPPATAQAVAVAEVEGYVTDPGGQGVTGAQVTITETGKNRSHTTLTNPPGGGYSFPNLEVGSYDLTV